MADNANKEIKTATADDGSTGYEMKIGLGTIAMLISATGMGLVPLFSRWATRTDMFDGALGLNAGDSIGALMAVGRMSMGVLFFVVIMFATGNRVGRLDDRHVAGVLRDVYAVDHHLERCSVHLHRSCRLRSARAHLPQGTHVCFTVGMPGCGVHRHVVRQQPDGFQRVWLLRRLQPGSVYA